MIGVMRMMMAFKSKTTKKKLNYVTHIFYDEFRYLANRMQQIMESEISMMHIKL